MGCNQLIGLVAKCPKKDFVGTVQYPFKALHFLYRIIINIEAHYFSQIFDLQRYNCDLIAAKKKVLYSFNIEQILWDLFERSIVHLNLL